MNSKPNKQNGTKPAVGSHSRSILDDRRIRLALSILGAIVAWMIVTIIVQPGTTNTIYNVPVDYTYDSSVYTSRGLSIVSAEDKTVNLKISGDGYTIGSLSANDFVVYPDWSSVRDSGEKSLRLQVRSQSTLLTGVSVSIDGDNTVDVVFDVVEEKTLPIQVTTNYLKIADGYILYGTDISKETVTLSGPSTELSKVETCTAEVTYSGELTSPVTLDTGLRFYTRSGGEVKFEYTTLETDSVEVTLQVYKLATLPVEVSFINAPRDFDPSVLVYSLSKKTLNVAGPESQIDRLSTLSVGTIDLSTFALDKVYEMPIELPSGIRLLDNISSITVSFDSSRLETKTMNLPASCVRVINLPSTYTLTVETERLMNVTLCGPAGSLEALNPEQVVIEIDADDFYVAIGQQNIACRLYVPANDKIFALGSYVVQCKIESN
jgi:YbbR domain-containing protein